MTASSRPRARFTSAAANDLDVIFAFVDERNRATALKLLARIEAATEQLRDFPNVGVALPAEQFEFAAPGIRFLVVDPYVIFYRTRDSGIEILRILHVRQDSLGLLFEQ